VGVVGVVDLAEQEDGERLFQEGEFWGMLGEGHPMLLWSGSVRMVLVLSHQTTQLTSRS
jgi:hypothetical protein